MTQTSNRLFDEMARLMTDAASVAQGVKREAETVFRTQMERWIADLDLVKREEFDVVREMASKARAENEALAARVAELEAKLAEVSGRRGKPRSRLIQAAKRPRREPEPASPALATSGCEKAPLPTTNCGSGRFRGLYTDSQREIRVGAAVPMRLRAIDGESSPYDKRQGSP